MSETNMDGSNISSEDGKQNEPLQTISTNIPEVTEIVDFTKQINTINSRVDDLEANINNKFNDVNNQLNDINSNFSKLFELLSNDKKEVKVEIDALKKKMEDLEVRIDTKVSDALLVQSNMSKGIRSDMSDMNIRINMIESSVSKVLQEQQTLSAQPIDIAEAVYATVQTEVQAHGDRLHQRIDEMELGMGNAMDARVGNIEERFHKRIAALGHDVADVSDRLELNLRRVSEREEQLRIDAVRQLPFQPQYREDDEDDQGDGDKDEPEYIALYAMMLE